MAKAFNEKAIERAVEEIFKDYKTAVKKAVTEATEKAKNDIHIQALSCLVSYYNDYNPSSYNRTYSLMECFVPYANPVVEKNGEYECVAGIEYDASRLIGTYSGSEIYTPTDAQWVIDNYLQGIHPRTDGSREVGGGNYENMKYWGDFVPAEEMQRFLDSYRRIFDKNFRHSLSKQVLKFAIK